LPQSFTNILQTKFTTKLFIKSLILILQESVVINFTTKNTDVLQTNFTKVLQQKIQIKSFTTKN
jgi:hypothetical protein